MRTRSPVLSIYTSMSARPVSPSVSTSRTTCAGWPSHHRGYWSEPIQKSVMSGEVLATAPAALQRAQPIGSRASAGQQRAEEDVVRAGKVGVEARDEVSGRRGEAQHPTVAAKPPPQRVAAAVLRTPVGRYGRQLRAAPAEIARVHPDSLEAFAADDSEADDTSVGAQRPIGGSLGRLRAVGQHAGAPRHAGAQVAHEHVDAAVSVAGHK